VKATSIDLGAETTSLATCWLLQRRDGAYYRYTDHDQAIEVAGRGAPIDGTYSTAVGYSAAQIESRGDLSVDEMSLGAILDDDGLLEDELRAGLFDYAGVWLFLVDWSAPGTGIVKLRRGTLGEITLAQGRFQAELRGLAQALQQTVGESYSAACRADLGDARCGVNLGAITVSGTLTSASDRRTVADTARTEPAGHFDNGVLTMAAGANLGVSREIKTFDGTTFELHQALPWDAAPGDDYSVVPGCQKTLDDCAGKFDNVVNFRGEPHVPGQDEALRYPDAG